MDRSEIDDMVKRERKAVAASNATIHRSREAVARTHQLVGDTKVLIDRARRRSRRAT